MSRRVDLRLFSDGVLGLWSAQVLEIPLEQRWLRKWTGKICSSVILTSNVYDSNELNSKFAVDMLLRGSMHPLFVKTQPHQHAP